ncbi:hypothetical protein C8A00DRAFT_37544 [Chaetomidium leptoderma]|uniref:Uncharacterized protein n=1 Tax=Chaetomidium leptoderma TaxID=669021 RepID=A0AAN6ZUZ4_9PEZI|nr:hypothetical protein C8A00DRAFT_37544 [Chaetomidium leptoderma]
MPRNANPAGDPEITIRLKYGIHTIFLFAMVDWPFSRVTTELLSILQDRYPNGLTASIAQPGATTPVPAHDSDVQVAYALPKNPNDLHEGWKNLKAQPSDTLGKKGLTDMCSVAFALLDPNASEAAVYFQVEVPTEEEDGAEDEDEEEEEEDF